MKYTTFTGEGYTGGAITRKAERTVYCCITVDLHQEHTIHSSAVEHLYSDALLSGATGYTREEFIDAVNLLGGSIGVNIQNSRLTITLRSLEENSAKLLKLFQAMMQSPTFEPTELKRIKLQTKNELIEHKENAKAIAQENFENNLYVKGDRRYIDTPEQLAKAVDAITQTNLLKLHSTALANIWTVTIGANAAVVTKIRSSVELCKKGVEPVVIKHHHGQKPRAQKTVLQNIPSKMNIEFAIGTSLPLTLHHPDYLPFVFGISVLGKWGGFTGRLMSTVREKEGLTYGIYARTESVEGDEQGHYRIMTFFAPDKAIQGITSTLRELKKIHKSGITQSEYERFQTIIQTQQTLLADSLTRSVETLHGYLCADFSLKEIEEYRTRLLTVSRKEINAALKTHLHPDKLLISGAGPIQSVQKEIQAIN